MDSHDHYRSDADDRVKARRNTPTPFRPALAILGALVLVLNLKWAFRWLLSGCATETILLLFGDHYGTRPFSFIPLWTFLATFNLLYAISATSWLLYWWFTALCYPTIALTCLLQFDFTANFVRKSLRKALRELHFTKDRIALFNLPALEIDQDVDGLMVVRGITISLSSLTIVAHGVELGLKLADDIELAMHVDELTISLFRRINVGDVYCVVKGGKPEMMFADLGDSEGSEAADDDSIFEVDTALLRAATAGSEGFKDRPRLRQSLTGVSWMKDSTAREGLDFVRTLSPDDQQAERQYLTTLKEIQRGSAIYQSREQVIHGGKKYEDLKFDNDKDMRAAICAELHSFPPIVHPPQRSIRVSTLQHLSPPSVRRFLHRLPFLLRLLLATLSYFHPIIFQSVNATGSGKWLTALLQQHVFKHYVSTNGDLRRLAKRVSAWLADAHFCLELNEIESVGRVPVNTAYDIVANLKFSDIVAYRTALQQQLDGKVTEVVRLGGADASVVVPCFLIPHHEHLLPPKPAETDELDLQREEVEKADGVPKTIQAQQKLKKLEKDETSMKLSVHASLPATFSPELLQFIAALVKATKIVEVEKQMDEGVIDDGPASPASPAVTDDESIKPVSRTDSGLRTNFKSLAKNLQQGLRDGGTGQAFREFASDIKRTTTGGMKKAVIGGIVNDRWIAKMVGKVAARLERAQGDLGYSGEVPIALEPYRERAETATKLLP
ncbi:hypothetical protein BAUCODRAFT_36569 [Baudoinia panamericana UAMH 10762]|uniref:Uncharacterized protein n=1 Tax=Baudoinia panamericana (strain UAMH 10762) TaxID=717646 RepID=M2N500_BAUPA|nr:uncharacterized protein BAUCODRAFT_36569 [Baudoinia panamericana UAMH 10762]EMC94099.1 hypothetical protein BAUCODRAFT_36569 [Baudoinia panamericana UAMH 10762]